MAEKTLTRMDLAEAVHAQVGLSRNDSATLVEAVLGALAPRRWRLRDSLKPRASESKKRRL